MNSMPLDGSLVVELGDTVAAAYAGMLLSQLGANVWRLESAPAQRSLSYLAFHRGKRAFRPDDRVAARDAIARADVVIGDAEALAAARLLDDGAQDTRVVIALTPFGLDGPYRDRLWSDLVVQAMGGLLHMVGEPDGQPLQLGGSQAQTMLGVSAFTGCLAALRHLHRTGTGQLVDVSMFESVAYCEWKSGAFYRATGIVPTRSTGQSQWLILRAQDGYAGVVCTEKTWPALKSLFDIAELDEERFATAKGRGENSVELGRLIESWLEGHSKLEFYHLSQAAGAPEGCVLDFADLMDSPQYAARGFWTTLNDPMLGTVLYPGVPLRSTAFAPADGPAPITENGAELRHAVAQLPKVLVNKISDATDCALEGVTVLDLGTVTAGGNATQMLADLGARVVKVESPLYPDPFRFWDDATHNPAFDVLHRNKLSVSIDLKTDDGRRQFLQLAATADVVIDNFRTGVLDNLGIAYDDLVTVNSDIIVVSISSQGSGGPESGYRSFGSTLEGLSGLASVTGYAGGRPQWSGRDVNYPDQVVSIYAAGIIIAAILHRERAGQGQFLEISQREFTSGTISDLILGYTLGGPIPGPVGNSRDGFAVNDCLRAAGEQWVAVSAGPEHRASLWELVPDPAPADDAISDVALRAALGSWVRQRAADDVVATLLDRGVPAALVYTAPELLDDEHLAARGYYAQAPGAGPDDPPLRLAPYKLSRTPPRIRASAPALGEHTDEVLGALAPLPIPFSS